jgi:hypothetical protein
VGEGYRLDVASGRVYGQANLRQFHRAFRVYGAHREHDAEAKLVSCRFDFGDPSSTPRGAVIAEMTEHPTGSTPDCVIAVKSRESAWLHAYADCGIAKDDLEKRGLIG